MYPPIATTTINIRNPTERPIRILRFELALIRNDDPTLEDQFRVQQVPIALEWISLHDHDIRELTGLDCPELIAHFDVGRGVWSHKFDDVLHREHEVKRF